jgi:benzoate 4-monooxygenase
LKLKQTSAFVSIRRGLFNTRDRAEHTRKRKIVSHVFAQKSVLEFEPHIQTHVRQLAQQWDRLSSAGARGESGTEGEGGWQGRDGLVWLDCLPWFNYLAFDIIGRLAFGKPFGMLVAAKDSAPVAVSAENAMSSYTSKGGSGEGKVDVVYFPAVQILNDRGEFSASLGVLPPHWRSFARGYIPWFRQGGQAVKNLAGLAIMAVKARLDSETDSADIEPGGRADLLAKLMQGKDDEGKPMGREEWVYRATFIGMSLIELS